MSKARLVLTLPDDTELVTKIGKDTLSIGRKQDCDIVLTTESVSTNHATIARDEDDPETYILTDLESTNGTKVNGTRIDRAELAGGEDIKIGGIFGKFYASKSEMVSALERGESERSAEEETGQSSSGGPRVSKGNAPPKKEDQRPKATAEVAPLISSKASSPAKARAAAASRRNAHVEEDGLGYTIFFGVVLVCLSMLLALCLRHFMATGGFFVTDFWEKARVITIAAPEPESK